jgi:hypothetical protein
MLDVLQGRVLALEDAEKALRTGIEIASYYNDRENLALLKNLLARWHWLNNDKETAHITLVGAIDMFERQGRRHELAEARAELARLEAQMVKAAE